MPSQTVLFEIKVPRENEYSPESAVSLASGFTKILKTPNFLARLSGKNPSFLILEIASIDQTIRFFAAMNEHLFPYFESQLLAAYPLAVFNKIDNFSADWQARNFLVGRLIQQDTYYYPIKTFRQAGKSQEQSDLLSSVLAVLSKASPLDKVLIQLVLRCPRFKWQQAAQKAIANGIVIGTSPEGQTNRQPLPNEASIKEKIAETGLEINIRLAASSQEIFRHIVGGFAAFARGDGNALKLQKPKFWQKNQLMREITLHQLGKSLKWQIMSVSEIASLWHLPNVNVKIPNIAWGKSVISEAPENLPTEEGTTEKQINETNFFAKTEFKNKMSVFGIKLLDRRRHVYIVGKTGTGKSTLIANMAINDIKKGQGLGVVDPHGDLSEILLDYIPKERLEDICYLNPADKDHPFSINILEVNNPAQAELVASGIVSIFYKLYAQSWGPRLEYILRNTLLTLTRIPGSTLVEVPRMLTDLRFADKIARSLNDPVLQDFWLREYIPMPEKLRAESISSILNKVGQFVSSPLMRQIIGRPKSTVDLEKIMNEGKIMILNLSQGRLGEDNAALLGAMIITKIQLAAMNRVEVPEEQRKDFFLYVDEFQNFATGSFTKILSEARKYRLCLTLANQYMAQIDEAVRKAILGNAGTLITFLTGAEDGALLEKEFGGIFTQNNMVGLSNFQIIIRLAIDNLTARPFFAYTLPLPETKGIDRQIAIRASQEKYSYKP